MTHRVLLMDNLKRGHKFIVHKLDLPVIQIPPAPLKHSFKDRFILYVGLRHKNSP